MKEFLATLSIWIGAIIGALTTIDWLLTEKQKNSFTEWCESLWLWLEYQRAGRFLRFLQKYKVQVISSIIILLLFLVFRFIATYLDHESGLYQLFPSFRTSMLYFYVFMMFTTVLGLSWKIHPTIITWTLKTNSIGKFYLRCLLVILLLIFLSSPFLFPSTMKVFVPILLSNSLLRLLITVYVFLLTGELLLIVTNFLLSLSWLILVFISMIFFRIFQFFLIRIIEYPKGPVLGLSGLLVGVAALVKAFL